MNQSKMNLQTTHEPRPSIVRDANKPINSDSLFAEGNEVIIQHQNEQYRLRRTRNGKLILTK
jgi:hemin uptake protein HemP